MNSIIGGEFSIDEKLLNNNRSAEIKSHFFTSGRTALNAILKDIGDNGVIYIPNFLCSSIVQTIHDSGWDYQFYSINSKLIPVISFSEISKHRSVILLINYFGLIDLSDIITEIKKKIPDSILILDNVQAYYAHQYKEIDYFFNSYRKWFPCPDGAEAWKKETGYMLPSVYSDNLWAQYKLAGNLLKNYSDLINDNIALELIEKGESLLDHDYHVNCSEASLRIILNLNLREVADIRKKNAKVLHEGLVELGVEHIWAESAVPLCLPIFVDNRDELRKAFFQERIFTPIHWKNMGEQLSGRNNLYDRELSLIVDQRYGESDMVRQLNVLKTMR